MRILKSEPKALKQKKNLRNYKEEAIFLDLKLNTLR